MNYALSVAADRDLLELTQHSLLQFGQSQTKKYLTELEQLFIALARDPSMGRSRTEIKRGLMCFPFKAHVIYYRIKQPDLVLIVRVLHGSRDQERSL